VRLGEVPLVGSGLDLVDGKSSEHHPVTPERVSEGDERATSIGGDGLGQGQGVGRDVF
jgi:hypothetical protein